MIELFEVISSFLDKTTQFFHVIFEKITDAWATAQSLNILLPVGIASVFIVGIILLIVLRILGR